MGFSVLPAHLSPGMPGHGFAGGDAERVRRRLEQYKRDWAGRLERLDEDVPIAFPGWDDWDDQGRALPEGASRAHAGEPVGMAH